MTCIAYRSGVLAADTLISSSSGDPIVFSKKFPKLVKTKTGIYGFAGSMPMIMALQKWAKAGGNMEDVPKGAGIAVTKQGVFSIDDKSVYPINDEYFAQGSGMNVAMGALYMGATAKEAVLAAIALSPGCGGEVQTLTL